MTAPLEIKQRRIKRPTQSVEQRLSTLEKLADNERQAREQLYKQKSAFQHLLTGKNAQSVPVLSAALKDETLQKQAQLVLACFFEAFDQLGGVDYLVAVGQKYPAIFLHTLTKLMPKKVTVDLQRKLGVVLVDATNHSYNHTPGEKQVRDAIERMATMANGNHRNGENDAPITIPTTSRPATKSKDSSGL